MIVFTASVTTTSMGGGVSMNSSTAQDLHEIPLLVPGILDCGE